MYEQMFFRKSNTFLWILQMSIDFKWAVLCFSVWLTGCAGPGEKLSEDGDMKLWYTEPADTRVADSADPWTDDPEWLKALPLGNGSLGAMVFGGVSYERIQLNEESVWSGSPQECDNPEAAKHLDEIRRLLFEGKYREATELTDRTQVCRGNGSGYGYGARVPFGCFQTLGDLWLDFGDAEKGYSDYRRELDLRKALVTVSYTCAGKRYRRELFASHPDQVLVMRISCDAPGSVSFDCRMNRPERYRIYTDNGQLVMSGALSDGKGSDGLHYQARLEAVNRGGKMACSDSVLSVRGADEVLLLLAASTSYVLDYPTYTGREYERLVTGALEKASGKTYDELLETHLDEYGAYYDRLQFRLDFGPDTVPTDRLVADARNGKVHPHLYELMMQYGRYLLISSSRPGTLPANLQGIWANKIQTPWNGDYHTDVNVEMNYWMSGVMNLAEMQLPLFDLMASLVEPGRRTASVQYGKRGWVVHPITNVWGYTSPGEIASWGMHTGAPAWICQHIGEHYRFTGDREFLRRMYPVLRGAVEFYMDWLCEDPSTGRLVSGPAVSPENTFVAPDGSKCQISMGPTHDQQTIRQLFDDFRMVSEVIGVKDEFVKQVEEARNRLAETCIAADGRIMEWARDYEEAEPGHRHMSHLFDLYPGSAINPVETPELAEAAGRSIDYRMAHGGGHTGWSAAWLTSLYARLLRADDAVKSLDSVLSRDLNANLFTLCPPFQIDANFGVVAGMGEMLLQSHVETEQGRVLQLLPALPDCWPDGKITGMRARGGCEADLEWKDGELLRAVIRGVSGKRIKVWYKGNYLTGKTVNNEWIWEK